MSKEKSKQRGLGRGLSALMADVAVADVETNSQVPNSSVPIENIQANPDQPRRVFSKEELEDLSNSIGDRGILQPLIVRKHPQEAGRYQIVAGERRWRAAQLARLHEVPVIVRDYTDEQMLEVAIVENIQREDLNPIEEARGYQQLMSRFNHTQEQVAKGMGKSRSHVANSMRLLQLPQDVLQLLSDGKLSAGHARALITTDNPSELARVIVAKSLSVREVEALSKNKSEKPKKTKKRVVEKSADTKALEDDLSAQLKMKVLIDHNENSEKGLITIVYKDLEQLDDLCRILGSV